MANTNTKKSGYKHTQLGWIPEKWEVKKIGEIASINPLKKVMKESDPVSFLAMADVSESGQVLNEQETVYGKVMNGFTNFEKNDVLVAKITPCFENGKGALIRNLKYDIGFGSTEFHVIRAGQDVMPNIIFYHTRLATFRSRGELNMVGSAGQKRVPSNYIKLYSIPLPPLSEQRRISTILSTWDQAITRQQQLINALQTRHRALMQQLLTGKKRLKGFKGEWKKVRLADIFERIIRKNAEVNNTVVTISAQRGFVLQTDFFNKNVASKLTDNYFLVEKGEFCYNKSYSNGYPWGAIKRLTQFEKAVVTTLYICFGIKSSSNSSAPFFEHYFEAKLLDKGIMKIAHEGGRAHGLLNVTPSDFFNLVVNIPNEEEQSAIAKVLTTSEKEIQTYRRRLAALQEQKKGLMQILLTGKVRVKV